MLRTRGQQKIYQPLRHLTIEVLLVICSNIILVNEIFSVSFTMCFGTQPQVLELKFEKKLVMIGKGKQYFNAIFFL